MRLPTEVVIDGRSRVLDTVLLRDGCAINLDVDLLCHRPGCSPAKGHDLGYANVLIISLLDSIQVAMSCRSLLVNDTCYTVRVSIHIVDGGVVSVHVDSAASNYCR